MTLPTLFSLFVCAALCAAVSASAQGLPITPVQQGGAGFEKIAASLGFETYEPRKEELFAFGDTRARTGGSIRLDIQFPKNFRTMGKDANYLGNGVIESLVYETLLRQHPLRQTSYVPGLATHWKISADKKTYTFRLDPRARFSNGKPVTARDVVATWRLAVDKGLANWSLGPTYDVFEEPRELSPYLVEVKTAKADFHYFLRFTRGLPILCADDIGNISGAEFIKKYTYSMPAGSGEYALDESNVVQGKSYSLVRRANYWANNDPLRKHIGNFDTITCKTFSIAEEYDSLCAGDIDVMHCGGFEWEQQQWERTEQQAIAKGWARRYRVRNNVADGVAGIAFNLRSAPFSDIRVRQAFALLYNGDTTAGGKMPVYSYYSNTPYAFTGHKANYDPQKAAKLLAEAGWKKKNGNGILVKKGKPFVVRIDVPESALPRVLAYQASLREAGIDVQARECGPEEYARVIGSRDFSMVWMDYISVSEFNPFDSWHSSLANKQGSDNTAGVKLPKVDKLCELYNAEFSTAEQERIGRQIDSAVLANYAHILVADPDGNQFYTWERFGMPEYVLPQFQTLYYGVTAALYWWYDEKKAAALARAMEAQDVLKSSDIITVDYWKRRAEKRESPKRK